MKKFDTLVIGTPTWAGNPSPYIGTFFNKTKNIKGKKAAVFVTGARNVETKERVVESIQKDLENLGMKIIDVSLPLRMKKEEIVDGDQNIEAFIKSILSK